MKKFILPMALTMTLSSTLISCGKKASENEQSAGSNFEHGSEVIETETYADLMVAIEANDISSLKRMLGSKKILDLNKLMENGETLMTSAVKLNHPVAVELLFDHSSQLLFKANARKETPLMVAAKQGHQILVNVLLSMGAKTDNKDVDGNTALHLSILSRQQEIAVILINAEANYEITNNANQTPYRLAEMLGLETVTKLLKSLSFSAFNLPDRALVTELILHGSPTALRQLLKKHPNLVHEYKDLNFFVMVQEKLENDKALAIAEVLISENADINGPRGLQKNPMITAVKRANLDFVQLFLKHNADLLIYDTDGKTALYHAVEKNHPEMVKALVSKNAQKSYTYIDSNGRRRSANVCNVARGLRPTLTTSEEKGKLESIMDELGCGLRWLF